MVPLRLQLHNFLSYGEGLPPLDFTGINIACLSGPNGHGKSALLEAMTWALWGEARKGGGLTKPHAGVVRSGATDVWVMLDFEHEGLRYRVRRSYRASGKSGKLELDLLVWDPAQEDYRILTRESVAETDARIVDILRMDYDTFVNSAFLKQGRADEFTRRRPAERKQILSDILGLSRYDRLRELARAKLQRVDRDVLADAGTLELLKSDLSTATEVRQRLAAVAEAITGTEARLTEHEARVDQVRQVLADDQRARERLAQLLAQVQQAEQELVEVVGDLAAGQRAVTELEALIERREETRQLADRLAALEAERQRLDEALSQRRELDSRRVRLEASIGSLVREAEADRRRLQAQVETWRRQQAEAAEVLQRRERIRQEIEAHQALRERLAAAERDETAWRATSEQMEAVDRQVEKARVELEAELRQVGQRLREARQAADEEPEVRQRLEAARSELEAAEQADAETLALERQLAEAQGRFLTLKACSEQLQKTLDELAEHEAILAGGGGQCPVCGQKLGPRLVEEVHGNYAHRRGDAERELRELRAEGRSLKDQRQELEDRQQRLKSSAALCGEKSRQVARWEHALTQALAARAEHERLDDLQKQLKARLAEGDYAPDAQQTRRRLRRQLDELEYQPEALASLRRAVDLGRQVERDRLKLEQAERSMAEVETELPPLVAELEALDARLREQTIAGDERAELAQVLKATEAIEVDPHALAAVDAERRELADVPLRLQRIEDAERRLPAEQERLAELRRRQENRERSLRDMLRQRDDLQGRLIDRGTEEKRLTEARDAAARDRLELANLREERGKLQETAERQRRQAEELETIRERLHDLQHEKTLLEHLVTAFGRDGIPALIIENAVPEIETVANELLGRLSDYSMSLAIRLQRPLQSGAEKETLDIEISDELGTRSYENYSGGEAFRVNFALRLALSQLLARRARAQLRTLIIDEGFGTQDEEGIEQLVGAIHAVRDHFDLILVVTHLTSLKERFPVRIEVHKDPERGSSFTVVAAEG